MHPEIVNALACPHDGRALQLKGRVLGCAAGHRFDLARQGYATLISRPLAHQGDPVPLVDRRVRVHDAGLLTSVHRAVIDAARTAALPPGIVCDVGAGPGSYLAAVLDALTTRHGLAVDVSKAAIRRAARCHDRAGAVVADVWDGLPIRTGAASLLLDVFAPRAPEEYARVLAPGGTLLVVTPQPHHLDGVRETFDLLAIEADKAQQLASAFGEHFTRLQTADIGDNIEVTADQAADLAGMGPSGHHLDDQTLMRRAGRLPHRSTVRIAVTLTSFRRLDTSPSLDRATARGDGREQR